MKIVTIIGARPQFIKAAAVSSALIENRVKEIILHTGQHYDKNMSDVFFHDLHIPKPAYNIGIRSSTHGAMTGRMLEKIEAILIDEKPNIILVYGDTNSTLAGALAASKLHIPIAHVEAGLRSFNKRMPEETNRILTDHMSDLLFAPTNTAVKNLKNEGITKGVHHTGDVMYDAAVFFGKIAEKKSKIIGQLGLKNQQYFLSTIHRAENTDNPKRLESIINALVTLSKNTPVVLPLHPRTLKIILKIGLAKKIKNLNITKPLSFLDMVVLEKNAKVIITDSDGVQKEAYFHLVPCVTLRDETEWIETVNAGWNSIAGSKTDEIIKAVKNAKKGIPIDEYGIGKASEKIVKILKHREL